MACAIVLLLFLPLSLCIIMMRLVGVVLNSASSVLYGTVPELAPSGGEARAFGLFYTATSAADAVAPIFYGAAGDWLDLTGAMLIAVGVSLLIVPLADSLRPILRHAYDAFLNLPMLAP
jgi:FSR family fosmidomycin resistance protein-like MFS transporter